MARKILIIDDEEGMRKGLQRILTGEGYEVETAENGIKGLELFSKNNFDIALVDLKLPDLDGIEIIKRISSEDETVIVIMMTAYASFETAVDSVKSGAFDYISKPFSPDEILYAIMRGLKKREVLVERQRLLEEKEESLFLLAEEKSQFEQVVEGINEAIAVMNLQGFIVKINQEGKKLLLRENQNRPLPLKADEIHAEEIKDIINEYLKAVDSNSHSYHEIQLKISEDEKRHYLVGLSPVVLNNTVRGAILTIRDIENFKRIQEEQGRFLRIVAHELKAPVNATVSILELLSSGYVKDPQKHADFLVRASERCRGLVQMIEDLLELSRMEVFGKQGNITFDKLDFAFEIRECTDFFSALSKEEGIDVEIDIEEGIPMISGNQGLIRQLLNNLISNGIKYNQKGGKVWVQLKKYKSGCMLQVKDNGIGIEKEKLQGLFREFYRVKNTQTQEKKGTGLGLSIARKAVELHGGTIEVESTFGQGTTFCVKFPCEE